MLGYGAILRGRATAAVGAVALMLVAGCGGSGERQDANDSPETYSVEVTREEFPARQALAQETEMRIDVRNVDDRTIPNIAATIEMDGTGTEAAAFGTLSEDPGLSSRSRPVWVVDEGPLSGDTAYPNTWALGPLEPGRTARFVWRVTPVEPGRYVLDYRLAGSLTGGARLETADGTQPSGRFVVRIADGPRRVRVTDDGQIVREPAG